MKEEKGQQHKLSEADKKINTEALSENADTLKNSATTSQNSTTSGQMSGGAVQPIQSGNQSREEEQSDLR